MTIVTFCKYLVLNNFLKRSLNNSKNWMDLILHMDLMFSSRKNYVVYEIKILFASPSVNMLIPGNILTLFQCYLLVDMSSQCGTTSNQRWNNVPYFNVGIYNVKQRRINVVYFNVKQCRNNVVLFNFEIHNIGQRWNSVVKMIIFKKNKEKLFQIEYIEFKVLTTIS